MLFRVKKTYYFFEEELCTGDFSSRVMFITMLQAETLIRSSRSEAPTDMDAFGMNFALFEMSFLRGQRFLL